MNTCQTIQQALAAAEPLSASQQDHVRHCPDCTSFELACATTARLLHAGRIGPPPDDRVSAVRNAVLERTAARPARGRLVWASCALALGIVAVVAVLWLKPGGGETAAGERLIALMDDVDAIAAGSQDAAVTVPTEEDLYVTDVLYQNQEPESGDSGGELPGAYQVLDQALESDWL